MDPDSVTSGFHRSMVVEPGLTSRQVLGGSATRPIIVQPELEPSLVGLGVTFGAPDLTTTPTAGSATRLVLPVAQDAVALLPKKLMIGTRWDRLDGPAPDPLAAAASAATPAPAAQPQAPAAPDSDPGRPPQRTPRCPTSSRRRRRATSSPPSPRSP